LRQAKGFEQVIQIFCGKIRLAVLGHTALFIGFFGYLR
jgi:hypothetical protein